MTNAVAALDQAIKQRGGAAAVLTGTSASPAHAKPANPLDLLGRWVVTQKDVEEMAETRMIWRNVIAETHLAVWSAPANGGKTTVAKFAAGELAANYTVLFFQEDAASGDIPGLFEHARDHGYSLLSSAIAGSTDDQMVALRKTVKAGARLDGVVLFFDTLKKYCDLMSKGGSRSFFKLMRSLTQLGATIILLGHTNKHKGVDGKLMFEGVGDVRNDVDELIYIDATDKDARGVVTLTMRPDKTRCAARETTFELDTRSMQIRPLDRVVNVAAIVERQRQMQTDQSLIDVIRSVLAHGGMKHTELRDQVAAASGKSKTTVVRVLERYMSSDLDDPDALWIETRLRVNNTRHISLKPRAS